MYTRNIYLPGEAQLSSLLMSPAIMGPPLLNDPNLLRVNAGLPVIETSSSDPFVLRD